MRNSDSNSAVQMALPGVNSESWYRNARFTHSVAAALVYSASALLLGMSTPIYAMASDGLPPVVAPAAMVVIVPRGLGPSPGEGQLRICWRYTRSWNAVLGRSA